MTSVCINYIREFGTLDIITSDNLKLRLQTYWSFNANEIDSVDIILVFNRAVWKGSISRWVLQEKANDLNLQCKDYCDSLKYAMVSPWGPKNDILSFKDGVLSWQKILKSGAYISFGDFSINIVEDSSLLADTISSLLDHNRLLQENFELISERNSNITKEWELLKEINKEMLATKLEMETTIYAKIAAILNEKKRQLNDLPE